MDWEHFVGTKIALIPALAVAAGVVCSAPAAHASTYSLTGTNVDLALSTDAADNITSASGTFFGDTVDLAGGKPGGPANSGGFEYDNVLLPTLTPAFDNLGLLLGYVSGPTPFTYGNIYGVVGGTYGLYEGDEDLGDETLALTATPLPATWTMLIAGLIGVGYIGFRGSKKNFAAIAAA
jgi:hypothetical protein